jgi:hypothetical protein
VAQGLSEVTLSGATGANDQYRRTLPHITPGGQVMDQRAVELR